MVVGELKRGHKRRLYVLVEHTLTATIERTVFQSWKLTVGLRFFLDLPRTISMYGADRNVPFLYVLVELRFQSTAQIVADRNLEIYNGSDVLEFYKFRNALTCLKSHDVFLCGTQKTQSETLESYTSKLNSTLDSLTRKYNVERPFVNKHIEFCKRILFYHM